MSHPRRLTATQMRMLDARKRVLDLVVASGVAGISRAAIIRATGFGECYCAKRLNELAQEGLAGASRGAPGSDVLWLAGEHHRELVAERLRREALRIERAERFASKLKERALRAAIKAQEACEADAWAADRGITRLAVGQYSPIQIPGRIVASVFHLGA